MSHMNESCHIWMSHVPHINESCDTYEWVMSHIIVSHVTHMNESCHIWMCHVTHMNAIGVMSHIFMSHVTHMSESCDTYEWVPWHIWISHDTYISESCHIYDWITTLHEQEPPPKVTNCQAMAGNTVCKITNINNTTPASVGCPLPVFNNTILSNVSTLSFITRIFNSFPAPLPPLPFPLPDKLLKDSRLQIGWHKSWDCF